MLPDARPVPAQLTHGRPESSREALENRRAMVAPAASPLPSSARTRSDPGAGGELAHAQPGGCPQRPQAERKPLKLAAGPGRLARERGLPPEQRGTARPPRWVTGDVVEANPAPLHALRRARLAGDRDRPHPDA